MLSVTVCQVKACTTYIIDMWCCLLLCVKWRPVPGARDGRVWTSRWWWRRWWYCQCVVQWASNNWHWFVVCFTVVVVVLLSVYIKDIHLYVCNSHHCVLSWHNVINEFWCWYWTIIARGFGKYCDVLNNKPIVLISSFYISQNSWHYQKFLQFEVDMIVADWTDWIVLFHCSFVMCKNWHYFFIQLKTWWQ